MQPTDFCREMEETMRQRTSRYYKILSLLLSLWGLSLVTGTMLFGMGGSLP
jgi:hypothetical protein